MIQNTSKLLLTISVGLLLACSQPSVVSAESLPPPSKDLSSQSEKETQQTAIFAGGCFWCVEAVFEQLKGVTTVVSGYAGGSKNTADYKLVASGVTKHAEVVKITYDSSVISYGELLQVFFATHDPTTKDRQGPDSGTQYRSAVFFETEEQKKVTQAYIRQLENDKVFSVPIVTTLEPLGEGFFVAEEYHQDFVVRNPNHGYVKQWALPKIAKVQKEFKDKLKTK